MAKLATQLHASIVVSAPGKIHLLGEHTVVYGKPALLSAIDLRVTVTCHPRGGLELTPQDYSSTELSNFKKTIESIIKKCLKIKAIPPYQLEISSQIPIGAGLGSSAAISAAYIAALLSFLKVKWDLDLVNKLTFEAEKVFHGNPSGGDNTTVVYGGLIYYTKGKPIKPFSFSIPPKLAKNFILINTGVPKETTKEMVGLVKSKVNPSTTLRVDGERSRTIKNQKSKFKKIFDQQEQLVKELLSAIQNDNENRLIQIIRAGEKNLEKIGVVSPFVKTIIREIEELGGAAKICGGGGKTGPTGILLCYHPNPSIIKKIANDNTLDYFKCRLGVEGLKNETK